MIPGELKNRITLVLMRDYGFSAAQALETVSRIEREKERIKIDPGESVMGAIEQGVREIFGVPISLLQSHCKKQILVHARYAVTEVLSSLQHHPEVIGALLNRGRSNVTQSLTTIQNLRQTGFQTYTNPADKLRQFVRAKISDSKGVSPSGQPYTLLVDKSSAQGLKQG